MTITLATATPGGGFPLYGGVVAEVINAVDPSLQVECRNTKGSTENVPLLEKSQVDLGLVTGEVAFADAARSAAGPRILAAMYATAGVFVVRGDNPARSIGDLKGKPGLWRTRFRAGGPRPVCARRSRPQHGTRFHRDLSR